MVAAANGIGIVGVAPEAKIVAVRVATDAGYFYPAATVCAFMHAAKVGIDVTSNRCQTATSGYRKCCAAGRSLGALLDLIDQRPGAKPRQGLWDPI
jgi:hypothetical protein